MMADDHIPVNEYVEGALNPAERLAADRHLTNCAQCRLGVESAKRSRAQATGPAGLLTRFTGEMLEGSLRLLLPALKRLPAQPAAPSVERPLEPRFPPLKVLQPRVATGARRLVALLGRFGLVLVITIGVLLLPRPPGLSEAGHRALAVFAFTGSMLALEPVSLPIAALMIPVSQVALRTATAPQAFETFSRPVVFLILASLFLAEALRKHGLTRRLALGTILASGGAPSLLVLGLMGIAAALSMWVENTATAAVLIPVALTISRQIPDPDRAKRLLVALIFGIAYGASLGGMVTVMGSASNAVASGFLSKLQPWSFVDWMKFGLPAFLLIFPLTWWILLRLVKLDSEPLSLDKVQGEVQKLGALRSAEREILIVMVLAAFFWVTGSFLEPALGLPPTLLSAAVVAVLAVAALAIRNIIQWEDVKGVSWGIFLIIGAGLSLGETLGRTGATEWFADLITPLVTGPPFILSLVVLVYLSALLTNVMNNTTIAAVFVPILISLAGSDPSLNAVQLVLPVTLATTFGYSLPSASGRMALISATGLVGRQEMMRYGLVMTLISSATLAAFFYLLIAVGLI